MAKETPSNQDQQLTTLYADAWKEAEEFVFARIAGAIRREEDAQQGTRRYGRPRTDR